MNLKKNRSRGGGPGTTNARERAARGRVTGFLQLGFMPVDQQLRLSLAPLLAAVLRVQALNQVC